MNLIITKKQNAKILSSSQKTFNQHVAKLKKLQDSIPETEKKLNDLLLYYHKELVPVQQAVHAVISDCIKLFYEFYKGATKLSRKERFHLRELILAKIDEILSKAMPKNVDPEIAAIFEDLNGVNIDDAVSDELNILKESFSKMFKDQGIDIDLTSLDDCEDETDIMEKMFEAMENCREKMINEENERSPRKKTKKQLEKELKIQEVENLKKKGLATIYKKLAKVFHPDLEQNASIKIEKMKLMKELTTAYDKKDLHTLLLLEINHINLLSGDDTKDTLVSDEQLKVYNAILNEQIKMTKIEIENLHHHPRYFAIQEYVKDVDSPVFFMKLVIEKLKQNLNFYQHSADHLRGKSKEKFLKSILKEFSEDF